MHCSLCNAPNHNKRTCPLAATPSEIRIAKDLSAILGPPKKKKGAKPLEGLYGCKNIFKEPLAVKKKGAKPLEGLYGCKNIFKEPLAVKKKKVAKPLEGLYGCKNIFKEPPTSKKKKVAKPLEGLYGCKNIFKEPPASVAWAYNPSMWEKENKVES